MRMEFPLSQVADIGNGILELQAEGKSVLLRLGYAFSGDRPENWRSARLPLELAKQLGDALLSFAASPET